MHHRSSFIGMSRWAACAIVLAQGPGAGLWAETASQSKESRPVHEKRQALATDQVGDPLPAGVLSRMGTTRFRHGNHVSSLAYSPDGKVLASAGYDNAVRIWDPATGKELRKLGGSYNPLSSVSFSPDGKTIVAGSYDNVIRFWDAASGNLVRQFINNQGGIQAVLYAPDGKTVATRGWDNVIWLWDARTGKQLRRFEGHEGQV